MNAEEKIVSEYRKNERKHKIENLKYDIGRFIAEVQKKKPNVFMLLQKQRDVEFVINTFLKEELPIEFTLQKRPTQIKIELGFHWVSFTIYPKGCEVDESQSGTLTDLFQALSKLPKI